MPHDKAVYIVDDEAIVRDSISILLAESGYIVESYESAEEFLDVYRPGTECCILVDLRMKGIDGFTLLKTIRATDAGASFVVMTGHATGSIQDEILAAGAFGFLEKPFHSNRLLEVIRLVFESRTSPDSSQQDTKPLVDASVTSA